MKDRAMSRFRVSLVTMAADETGTPAFQVAHHETQSKPFVAWRFRPATNDWATGWLMLAKYR
jgi:hypothetical protein